MMRGKQSLSELMLEGLNVDAKKVKPQSQLHYCFMKENSQYQ